jgi:hypothetical protein
MTGLDALQSVQYVNLKGERFAVVSVEDWEALIEWLESHDDAETARQAYAELQASGGNRESAGWLRWDDVQEELE